MLFVQQGMNDSKRRRVSGSLLSREKADLVGSQQVRPVEQSNQQSQIVQPITKVKVPDITTPEGKKEYGAKLQQVIDGGQQTVTSQQSSQVRRLTEQSRIPRAISESQFQEAFNQATGGRIQYPTNEAYASRSERFPLRDALNELRSRYGMSLEESDKFLDNLNNILNQVKPIETSPVTTEPTSGGIGTTIGKTEINTGTAPATYVPEVGAYQTRPITTLDVAPAGLPPTATNIPMIASSPASLNLSPINVSPLGQWARDTGQGIKRDIVESTSQLNLGGQPSGAIASLMPEGYTTQVEQGKENPALWAIGSAILGNVLDGDKDVKVENQPIELPKNVQSLLDYITNQYGGEIKQPNLGIESPQVPFVAGATPEELTGMQGIADIARMPNQYLTESLREALGGLRRISNVPVTSDLLERTAGGEFLNPETSPYLKPMVDAIDREAMSTKQQIMDRQQRDLAALRNEFAGRGTIDSTMYNDALARMKQVQDEELQQVDAEASQRKLGMLGDIYSRERPIQYGAESELFQRPLTVGQAALTGGGQLGQYSGLPQQYGLQANEALAEAGGILRGITQNALNLRRAEDLRQLDEMYRRLAFPVDLANAAAGRTITTVTPPSDSSSIFQLLGAALPYFQRQPTVGTNPLTVNIGGVPITGTAGSLGGSPFTFGSRWGE